MARDLESQRNLWGAQADKAVNAQRADLWTVDFSQVVSGLNTQIRASESTGLSAVQPLETYFCQSVTLPELKVNADSFKRDSRPYMMPTSDDPLGAISAKFYLENPLSPQRSVVYQLFDTWRAYVRGGRGAYAGESYVPTLGANWKVQYAFDVTISLYRGAHASEMQIIDYFTGVNQEYYGDKQAFVEEVDRIKDPELKVKRLESLRVSAGLFDDLGIKNDLKRCGIYTLKKMWLSSFKLSDLNYTQGNQLVLIDATFYAENLQDTTVK